MTSGATHAALRLDAAGFGKSLGTVGTAPPRPRANRVDYDYQGARMSGLRAWYANGPLGLEQGFTVASAPVARESHELTLAIGLAGDVRAVLAKGGHSVLLTDRGGPSLSYGSLSAVDVHGRTLHSWLGLQGHVILLHVDTGGAVYPLRVDPLVQRSEKLTASEEEGQGSFGASVALSADGDTALVGAPGEGGYHGAAWFFTRTNGVWTQHGPKLTGPREGNEEGFGNSVALSANGDTALISAPAIDERNGAVYVYTRSGGEWTLQGEKLTVTPGAYSGFGDSLALSEDGDTAVIGAEQNSQGHAAAFVFQRSGESWVQQGPALIGSGQSNCECSGDIANVALSGDGDTAAVSYWLGNNSPSAVWIFTRSGESWTQQARLTSGEGNSETYFGYSLALSEDGDTAVFGGWADDRGTGAAWVFTRTGESWSQQGEKLTPGEEPEYGAFGISVALSSDGNTALVGASNDSIVWTFARSGETWSREEKLTGSGETGPYGAAFGASVALSGNGEQAVIGGPGDSDSTGAVWPFAYEQPVPPSAETGGASGITQTAATVTGSVDPHELPTTCTFEYGPTEEYGRSVPCDSGPGSGGSNVEVSAHVEGLEADAGYHYRLVAHNQGGFSYGGDETFETLPNAPAATTGPASDVTPDSADLTGTVDPEGGAVKSCSFEYGTTSEYGSTASCSTLPGAVHTPVPVSAAISGLQENTTYHFRLIAGNAGGTNQGSDQQFTTAGPPDFGRCVTVPPEDAAATRRRAQQSAELHRCLHQCRLSEEQHEPHGQVRMDPWCRTLEIHDEP